MMLNDDYWILWLNYVWLLHYDLLICKLSFSLS